MIIYGSKASHLKTIVVAGTCKNCGEQNSLHLSAYQKYAHIFWIPFFPLNKVYLSHCDHCKQVLKENEIQTSYRGSYEDLKNQIRLPLWTFAGLALVTVGVVFSVISEQQKTNSNAILIQTPASGDVYDYKNDDGNYTLLKVDQIIGDTVYVFPNNYEATKVTALVKLKSQGDTTYSDLSYPILKNELVKMFAEKKIVDITRR